MYNHIAGYTTTCIYISKIPQEPRNIFSPRFRLQEKVALCNSALKRNIKNYSVQSCSGSPENNSDKENQLSEPEEIDVAEEVDRKEATSSKTELKGNTIKITELQPSKKGKIGVSRKMLT